MSSNDRKSTLSLKHSISGLSHEKHAHSPKRRKAGKNAVWQGRRLVAGQRKPPVSRRNRELGHQMEGIHRRGRDTDNLSHTQTTLKRQANTCQAMIENQHFHSSTASQYPATRNTHTHTSDESPPKTPGSRADNWLLFKEIVLYRGYTES